MRAHRKKAVEIRNCQQEIEFEEEEEKEQQQQHKWMDLCAFKGANKGLGLGKESRNCGNCAMWGIELPGWGLRLSVQ